MDLNQGAFPFAEGRAVRRSEPLPARRNDPVSSRLAAERIVANGKRTTLQDQTVDAIRRHPRKTMQELADITGLCRFMLGRRVSECERKGLIRRLPERVCAVTGYMAEPWEIAE